MLSTKVLGLLLQIPKGKVTTYGIIANKLKTSPRAIGRVLKENHNYKYPCYKVVLSTGNIGQYNKGQTKKKELLEKDNIKIKNNKIIDFENVLWK